MDLNLGLVRRTAGFDAALELELPACAMLARLREHATRQPIDVSLLAAQTSPEQIAIYRARINAATIDLPDGWRVSCIVETGRPFDPLTMRRRACISLAGATSGRQLPADAVFRVVQRLGFEPGPVDIWLATRAGRGRSVNLDQVMHAGAGEPRA